MKIAAAFLCLTTVACVDETNLGTRSMEPEPTPLLARWAHLLAQGEPRGIAATSDGNVVVGETVVGRDPITSNGLISLRVSSDGSERWAAEIVPTSTGAHVDVRDVAVDPGDDVIVAGSFQGDVEFGGQVLSSPDPFDKVTGFVAKYRGLDGSLLWVRKLTAGESTIAVSVVADASSVVVASEAMKVVDDTFAQDGCLLLALDHDGAEQWRAPLGAGESHISDLTFAFNHDLVVSGYFTGVAPFGGVPIGDGTFNAFVARFETNGLYLASRAISGVAWESALIALPDGSMLVEHLTPDSSHHASNITTITRSLDDELDDKWMIEPPLVTDTEMRTIVGAPSGPLAINLLESVYNSDQPDTMAGTVRIASLDTEGNETAISELGTLVSGGGKSVTRWSGVVHGNRLFLLGTQSGTWDYGTGPLTAVSLNTSEFPSSPYSNLLLLSVDLDQ